MNSIDFKIKNLAEIFDGKIIGDEKLIINGVSSIENANEGDITFLSNNKYSKYLSGDVCFKECSSVLELISRPMFEF